MTGHIRQAYSRAWWPSASSAPQDSLLSRADQRLLERKRASKQAEPAPA
jgi:hypothetical protein